MGKIIFLFLHKNRYSIRLYLCVECPLNTTAFIFLPIFHNFFCCFPSFPPLPFSRFRDKEWYTFLYSYNFFHIRNNFHAISTTFGMAFSNTSDDIQIELSEYFYIILVNFLLPLSLPPNSHPWVKRKASINVSFTRQNLLLFWEVAPRSIWILGESQ